MFALEYLAFEVATSLSGEHIACVLRRLSEVRALPDPIVQDNGTEFGSKAMHAEAGIRIFGACKWSGHLSVKVTERFYATVQGCESSIDNA